MPVDYKANAEELQSIDKQIRELTEKRQGLITRLATDPNIENWAIERMKSYDIFKTDAEDELAVEFTSGKWHKEITYPITVSGLNYRQDSPVSCNKAYKRGFVQVRLVEDSKTYLGLYIGDVPATVNYSYNIENKILSISKGMYNPAIYVFDLEKIVMGYESWWGLLDDQQKARLDLALGKPMEQITDEQIQSIPYVKALQALNAGDRELAENMMMEFLIQEKDNRLKD